MAALVLFACNNPNNNAALLEKENERLKRELELEKKEDRRKPRENFNPNLGVDRNLIHCQNEKFILRVDMMSGETLRYTTWTKPKNEASKPSMMLFNGQYEKQGSMGGYIYTFQNNEWLYIVEDKQMGESVEATGTFLKLFQNETQILYTKMKDIK